MRRRITLRACAVALALVVAAAVGLLPAGRGPGQAAAAAGGTTIYLPFTSVADFYAEWAALGQPAGGAAVNYLYVGPDCAGGRPKTILAATDKGLYSYGGGLTWTRNTALRADMEVSHILNTSAGMFLTSYNIGLWHSGNGGTTWAPEPLPGSETFTRWMAANDQFLYVAGDRGLYRRALAGGAWATIRGTATYVVAASGGTVYAAEIGPVDGKDTLYISTDSGATWPITRQLPGAVDWFQTFDTSGTKLLIGTVDGGLFALDGSNNVVPFSQGINLTASGIWRDAQGRVYAAFDAPGGLRRFPAAGGASDLDLSALPGAGGMAGENLYTVNGSCDLIVTGSENGNVWARRIP